jgi:hypothetical protein
MAYDKDKIFKQAKKVAVEKKLIFIEEIVAFLPCDKTTFYRLFQIDSNEYNEIREIIDNNKVNIKVDLRKRWHESDNATLQMCLYKLTANPQELAALTNYKQDDQQQTEKVESPNINFIQRDEQSKD